MPPFISTAIVPPPSPWHERPSDSFAVLLKGPPDLQLLILDRVRQMVRRRHPTIGLDQVIDGRIPQRDLLERIGRVRHFLSLSVAEGFGLVPLEAMAMGTTVLGFDGFGGRDYMRPGVNCAVTAYPDVEGVAEQIADMLDSPSRRGTAGRRGPANGIRPALHAGTIPRRLAEAIYHPSRKPRLVVTIATHGHAAMDTGREALVLDIRADSPVSVRRPGQSL